MRYAQTSAAILVVAALAMFSLPLAAPSAGADQSTQTDWAGGGGDAGPCFDWGATFESCADVSYRSVPGQLALASNVISEPQRQLVASGHDGAYGLYCVDIDYDGDTDVLGTTDSTRLVLLWRNLGTDPPTWSEEVVDSLFHGGTAVHPADIDRDGDLDLVGSAQVPGNRIVWWRNDGGLPTVWEKFYIGAYVPVACNVFAADLNGDERIDVLSTSWSGSYVGWWRNEGGDPIEWTYFDIRRGFTNAHSAFAKDVDGDGDNDVVATSAGMRDVMLFINEGGDPPTWTDQLVDGIMGGVRYACIADVDSDGLEDIVAAAFDGQIAWYRNDGASPIGWEKQWLDMTCMGGHYCYVADIDGNGAQDVVVAAGQLNSVFWYANDGADPISWTRHTVDGNFTRAVTAFPGDLDGDGDLEIVAASHTLGEFAWWDVTEFRPQGELQGAILDLRAEPLGASLDWTSAEPPGTDLAFQIRSSNEPSDLGGWSPAIHEVGPLTGPLGRYFQYKAVLQSSDVELSPLLLDFRLDWGLPAAAPRDGTSAREPLSLCAASPAWGTAVIRFALPEAAAVRFSVLDASGRLLQRIADRTLAAGHHQTRLPALAAGVYCCLLEAGDRRASQRIVIVK